MTVNKILVLVVILLAILLPLRLSGAFGRLSATPYQPPPKNSVPPALSSSAPPAASEASPDEKPYQPIDPYAAAPTLSALDSQVLLKYYGKDVKIEGQVTHIEYISLYYSPAEQWACIFFNTDGMTAVIPGSYGGSPWDFASYFRIIVKPGIMDSTSIYSLVNENITVRGTLDLYRGSPVIYLDSPDNIIPKKASQKNILKQ